MALKLKYLHPDKLKPYAKNPRKNMSAVVPVMESIKEFGFQMPMLVDEKMVVIVGHTRLKAAKNLGLESIPVLITDSMDEKKKRRYRLADNRLGEKAGWDEEALYNEIMSDPDFEWQKAGFDQSYIDQLEKRFNDELDINQFNNGNCMYPIEPVFSEKYDYVIIFTKNEVEFARIETMLQLQKKKSYKSTTVGKSKVLTFEEFEKAWESR